jgi:diadenosine tetraphosphate (Ap4A) HIT family hydrolase
MFAEHAVAMPHSNPLGFGHAIVAPRRHVALFYDLDAHEQTMVWEMVSAIKERISEALKVERFHVGFADFHEGGGHAHIHVVPRGHGDTFSLPAGIDWVQD